jgi:YtkA-like
MKSELGEQAMSALWTRRAAATLAITAMLGAASPAVHAEIRDYEFRLVKSEMKKGDAEVAVRLVNKKTGKLVPNAVIFAKRIDMAPDGMEMMASSIEQLPSNEPGVYRFKTELSMQGRWQLSLGAKVQGEEGSVESKLVVKALP